MSGAREFCRREWQRQSRMREMKNASKSQAHLYVWAAVESILEGSASPGRECQQSQKSVDRILKIVRGEMQRCLRNHDKAMKEPCDAELLHAADCAWASGA